MSVGVHHCGRVAVWFPGRERGGGDAIRISLTLAGCLPDGALTWRNSDTFPKRRKVAATRYPGLLFSPEVRAVSGEAGAVCTATLAAVISAPPRSKRRVGISLA